MADLSPAAQAVWEAFNEDEAGVFVDYGDKLAAALRAAANQCVEFDVPFAVVDDWEKIKGSCASFYAAAEWGYKQALKNQRAIAAELDGSAH